MNSIRSGTAMAAPDGLCELRRRNHHRLVSWALFAFCLTSMIALSTSALLAQVIDMRQCPVGAITFIDPWAGHSFKVTRVGTSYQYLCDDDGWVDQPIEGQYCRRYGDLVLVGELRDADDKPIGLVAASWHVLKALPCCGWSVTALDTDKGREVLKGLDWVALQDSPALGTFRFGGIDGEDITNMYPMICDMPVKAQDAGWRFTRIGHLEAGEVGQCLLESDSMLFAFHPRNHSPFTFKYDAVRVEIKSPPFYSSGQRIFATIDDGGSQLFRPHEDGGLYGHINFMKYRPAFFRDLAAGNNLRLENLSGAVEHISLKGSSRPVQLFMACTAR